MFAALVAQYLGFRSNHDEYKVMGLAPYGSPSLALSHILDSHDGLPCLDERMLHPEALRRHPIFHTDQLPMFASDQLPSLPPWRLRGGNLTDAHRDLAASAQQALTAALLAFIARHRTPQDTRLCLAGGVAENSVAAGTIVSAGLFEDVYLAPACGDAGTALGAELLVAAEHGHRPERLTHTQFGPAFPDDQVVDLLTECGIRYRETSDPAADAADLIADQKIVAWFQGRMEFGPSVLAEHMTDLFINPQPAPFMSFTLPTKHRAPIIAATHVDGTSRPHSVPPDGTRYRRLIEQVQARTGVPAVLNTSLNSGWEPIVARPDQALALLYSTAADALVIGNFVVTKEER
jgi:carbamoyltransferase